MKNAEKNSAIHEVASLGRAGKPRPKIDKEEHEDSVVQAGNEISRANKGSIED